MLYFNSFTFVNAKLLLLINYLGKMKINKKMLLGLMLAATTISTQAQALEGTKISDNWSIGINGGGVTPLTHSAFWGGMRGNVGLEVAKQLTPIFGLGVEGMWSVNTSESKTIFDNSSVMGLAKVNLMNLLVGYNGAPRLFEIEAVYGLGWLHTYGAKYNANYIGSKAGMNINFNLGETKAWTISLKPAVIWNLGAESGCQYNLDYAAFQLNAGVTYHFKGSNGKRHFTYGKLYNQGLVDNLNADINNLRNQLDNCNSQVADANNTIADLNAQNEKLNNELTECLNRAPIVETIANKTLESVVTFGQGQTSVAASQVPNVERIATYMKNNKESQVVIKGYASPEGNADVNARIARQRAESVKNMLVQRYKIAASRITAEGEGVGNMFSEPDWNRVSICTLIEE